MKKILIIIFITINYFVPIYAQFSGGNGTAANPYIISTKQDMEALADSVAKGNSWSKGKFFELNKDITNPVTKCN